MSTRPHPPLEGQPARSTGPNSAKPTCTPASSGAPKVAARKGVLSVLRPDPHTSPGPDQERVFFGLHIVAEPQWRIAVTAACPCGFWREVKGRSRVLKTIEDYARHKETCPRHTGLVARRHAA
ncbi:hypothetical protein ACH4TE_19720 [Streptomyces sioyaensis]|uniref:hypothetical protein n=1 Tax=Streptomyces sioyaensis TaxID=67364 RepID=UPI0037AF0A9F